MAMSRDEVFQQVQEVLVEALGVDDEEVKTDATLMGDLGAESIDFLDIVFRLEKVFEIKIPRTSKPVKVGDEYGCFKCRLK